MSTVYVQIHTYPIDKSTYSIFGFVFLLLAKIKLGSDSHFGKTIRISDGLKKNLVAEETKLTFSRKVNR